MASQLGDGTNTNRSKPVQVTGLTRVVGVAAGDWHSLTIVQEEAQFNGVFDSAGSNGDEGATPAILVVSLSTTSDLTVGLLCRNNYCDQVGDWVLRVIAIPPFWKGELVDARRS